MTTEPEILTIEAIEIEPLSVGEEAEILSSVVLPLSPFNILRPTLALPGLLDVSFNPLRMVRWSLGLFPPRLTATYRVRLENTGLLPWPSAALEEQLTAGRNKLLQYQADIGDLSGAVEPQISFSISGFSLIRALFNLVVGRRIRVKSQATVSGIGPFTKSFDIDANLPLP